MSSSSEPKGKRVKVAANQIPPPPPSSISLNSSGSYPGCRKTDGSSVGSEVSSSHKKLPGWRKYLLNTKDVEWIANVTSFKNAPFASRWNDFAKLGTVVELAISHPQFSDKLPVYWVGRLVYFAGYYGLVEFQSIEEDAEHPKFMWIPFFTHLPKPYGYCLKNKILLYPPSESPVSDPTNHVKKALECFRAMANTVESLPENHVQLYKDEINSVSRRFKLNEIVEALDRTDCSQFRIARVNIMLGDRMQVAYCDMSKWDEGFWFSQNSSNVHKLGWCQAVGAKLVGTSVNFIYPIPELTEFASVPGELQVKFESQMIFEMRHPVLPHKIVCGYVAQVLSHGYFLAGTDWTNEKELVEVVMHVTSDYILPLNYCRDHRINLRPPAEGNEIPKVFSWREYLQKKNCKEIPLRPKNVTNLFTQGCKLEAVNILSPIRLYPATVVQVAGHLLRIYFDGLPRLDETSYQWVSCQSSNIYPAGYSEIIGYKMTGRPESPNPIDHINFEKFRTHSKRR